MKFCYFNLLSGLVRRIRSLFMIPFIVRVNHTITMWLCTWEKYFPEVSPDCRRKDLREQCRQSLTRSDKRFSYKC